TQETEYPLAETIKLTLDMKQPARFALKFRVPAWSNGMSMKVNGSTVIQSAAPGTWAALSSQWKSGDRVDVQIPLRFRWQPVDSHHPDRAAIVRGPLVMPLEFRYLEPLFRPPADNDELNNALTPDAGTEVIHTLPSGSGAFRLKGTDGRRLAALVRPFYQYTEDYPYLMYIDKKEWPVHLW